MVCDEERDDLPPVLHESTILENMTTLAKKTIQNECTMCVMWITKLLISHSTFALSFGTDQLCFVHFPIWWQKIKISVIFSWMCHFTHEEPRAFLSYLSKGKDQLTFGQNSCDVWLLRALPDCTYCVRITVNSSFSDENCTRAII